MLLDGPRSHPSVFRLMFDALQGTSCDAMKDYFVVNAHGKGTGNDHHLVELPQMKTEFCSKRIIILQEKNLIICH